MSSSFGANQASTPFHHSGFGGLGGSSCRGGGSRDGGIADSKTSRGDFMGKEDKTEHKTLDDQHLLASHGWTKVQNNQESRCKYWATRLSFPLFACSALLALFAHIATLCCAELRSLVRFLTHSRARGKVNDKVAIFAVDFFLRFGP